MRHYGFKGLVSKETFVLLRWASKMLCTLLFMAEKVVNAIYTSIREVRFKQLRLQALGPFVRHIQDSDKIY